MYHHYDFEGWREYQREQLREADERRLARQSSAARSQKQAPEIRRTLLGLLAGLFPQSRKMAGC
jgi:hypothetical protein